MEVHGNFEVALINLLRNVAEGVKTKDQILNEWDKDRGNDWYTNTNKNVSDRISSWNKNHQYKGRQY